MKKAKKGQGFFSSKSFRHGGMSILFTVIFLILVILVNIVATAITDRYPLTLDLTPDKIHTVQLTEEHQAFVESIELDVNVIMCAGVNDISSGIYARYLRYLYGVEDTTEGQLYYAQIPDFLTGFSKMNPHINVRYSNPYSATEFTDISSKYSSEQINYGDILVECSFTGVNGEQVNRYQIITIDKMFEAQDTTGMASMGYGYMTITGSKVETAIVSALYIVTSEASVKCTVIDGYNTQDTSALQSLLRENNYEFNTITNLTTEDIPSDSQFVILCAPKTDLSAAELEKLDTFLENGGQKEKNLFYVASADQPVLPNLEEYLLEWGIEIYDETTYDPEAANSIYYPATYISASSAEGTNGEQPYTEQLDDSGMYFPIPYRTARALYESDGLDYIERIVESSSTVVGKPNSTGDTWQPTGDENTGPFDLLMRSARFTLIDGTDGVESSVIYCGSQFFFESGVLNTPVAYNAQVLLNVFNSVAGVDSTQSIEVVPKQITVTNFYTQIMESSLPVVFSIIFIAIIPVAVLVVGIIIWARRRRL